MAAVELYDQSLSLYDSLFTNKRNENRIKQFIQTKQELVKSAAAKEVSDIRAHNTLWTVKDTKKYRNIEFILPLMQSELNLRFAEISRKKYSNIAITAEEKRICLLFAYELLKHAQAYVHQKDIDTYTKQIKTLETDLGISVSASQASASDKVVFDQQLFLKEWKEFFQTIFHSSGIRAWIGLVNLERIALVCAKVAITVAAPLSSSTIAVFKDSQALAATTDVFYGLSVGLYALRIIEETLVSAKHVFFATELVRLATSRLERLIKEIKKRHVQFLNDFVWLIVNFLTNYIQISKLSIPLANQLLVVFLLFDLLLVAYTFCLARKDYLLNRARIKTELTQVTDTVELIGQLAQLDKNWQIKTQAMWFNLFAAAVVLAGFAAGLFTTTAYVLPLYFAVCVFGIALYLAVDNFENYLKERQLHVDRAEAKLVTLNDAKDCKAANAAWNKFIIGLTEQTVVPLMIVTVFAINWPAGLALALLYLTYKGTSKYIHLENAELPKMVHHAADEEQTSLMLNG